MKILTRMSKNSGHVPFRTCVSCRSKKDKKELLRLVLDKDNRVIIDELQRKNGRGIYLCYDMNCKDRFLKSKHPGRFFRTDKAVTIGFDQM